MTAWPRRRETTCSEEKLSATWPRARWALNLLPSKETTPAASWPRCCKAWSPRTARAAASSTPKMPTTPHSSLSLSSSNGLVRIVMAGKWLLVALTQAVHILALLGVIPRILTGRSIGFRRWLTHVLHQLLTGLLLELPA